MKGSSPQVWMVIHDLGYPRDDAQLSGPEAEDHLKELLAMLGDN
jgi:hypothetical protein